jgi:ribonuclease HI
VATNIITIFTDGGARGNPGPAAIGATVNEHKYREYVGEATNNVAEYKAVIFALKKVSQLYGKEQCRQLILEINVDSELLYNQIRGEYKVKDQNLQMLFIEVWNLKQDFKEVKFNLVPREKNKAADKLVNEELDSRLV